MIVERIKLAKYYLFKSKNTGLSYPSVIGIETTSRCNIDCIMCPRQEMTRQTGDMDIKLFKKIINDIKGKVEFIWLQDYGEPFLNKNIFKMIAYAKRHGLRTGISTNATVLNNDIIVNILNSGLDYIIFAFDGATKETYEKIRKGANFEKVTNNINDFLANKTACNTRIFTVVQCIQMENTESEINDFVKMWKVKGVDGIRIRQVTYSGKDKFENSLNGRPCYWLWSDPHIKWDGTVVPCCQDVNAVYPLGNIKENSLGKLWNSEKMIRLREKHISGKYHEIALCKGCNMYQPSLPLIIGSSFFRYFALNKFIPRVETILSKIRYREK
ncbi:radical SAM protein [Candidatus Kuenenia sp.]|uniref:radical SAM/SPASM domain-containing protein n=1 Tax=Candidatus Kuenenia sp. TaxID=2499824 RepID=UPI0032207EC1